MLDPAATRRRFDDWVRSPAFDPQFDAMMKRAVWPFVVGGVLIVSLVGILPGIWLVAYGGIREWRRRRARTDAHLGFGCHQPILATLVIGNRALFRQKGAVAPALLLGGFDSQDAAAVEENAIVATLLAALYGEDPAAVPPEHRAACELVNDDTFQADRRRLVPASLSPKRKLWLFDTMLAGDYFGSGTADSPFIPCMATPGTDGTIMQIPAELAVFRAPPYEPNIIQHKAPTEPPPIVAPIAENGAAIERHVEQHLGTPSSIFHEIISTTVHIDILIVPPSPKRPWVTLVTSGMSDLPMTVPEGAEEFRCAELMIRLPEDWVLDEAGLKNEANYWPIRWLKFLARFAHEAETWIGRGHTVPNGNPPEPMADGLPFTGVLLSPPWFGGRNFATLVLPDGTPVKFWSLIPLHSSEMEFKLRHGADALLERFAGAGGSDLFDPARPPVA